MREPFKNRNFRLLCLAEGVSYIGDQVSLIAFPWLALQMTGSPAIMGFVFACHGLPRALLMLFGGAVVDRTSPRRVMLASQATLMVLVAMLGTVIWLDQIQLWMVFACALCFGLVEAFFFPASSSIVPSIVDRRFLKEANAVVQVLGQMALFIGPALAGFVIAGGVMSLGFAEVATLAAADGFGDREGLARAFWFDSATFAVAFGVLLAVRPRRLAGEDAGESMLVSVGKALRYAWRHPAMRLFFLGIASLEIFFNAPFLVGMPVLIKQHWGGGAFEYGLIMSSYGGGALIGGVIAGLLPTPPDRILGRLMFALVGYSGLTLGLIAIVSEVWIGCAIFSSSGLGDGFVFVHFAAWLQKVTPDRLLGRVMAIFMFVAWGLLPLANAVMGVLIEWNLHAVLIGSAIIIVAISAVIACHPDAVKLAPIPDAEGDAAARDPHRLHPSS
ncbi:MAG: MFS transporter [Deltaproteobacteria bacterium]|nr:MFS transporter [Deltaproteobacteria bacterium]